MTTVGSADISPQTDEGRVIAMCVMVVAIGFLTMVIGAVSQHFIAEVASEPNPEDAVLAEALEVVEVEFGTAAN
jgi:voltage-gated potassium channel